MHDRIKCTYSARLPRGEPIRGCSVTFSNNEGNYATYGNVVSAVSLINLLVFSIHGSLLGLEVPLHLAVIPEAISTDKETNKLINGRAAKRSDGRKSGPSSGIRVPLSVSL